MTDYLPAPPAEIVLTPAQLAESGWNAQGGTSHRFSYMTENGEFSTATVADYARFREGYYQKLHQIQQLDAWLSSNAADYDLDAMQEIADIFGIVLEREYEFDVMVRFSGTFTAPPGVEPERVIENFSFEMNEGYYQEDGVSINDSDYQVEGSDWYDA